MAETVYTPDGKMHTLLGSTTPISLIREYAGDDLANWAEEQLDFAEEYREEREGPSWWP